MPYFKNFNHHMVQLALINDMNRTDDWAEMFALTVTEGELHEAEIREAAVIFASNLWREGQEDTTTRHHPTTRLSSKGAGHGEWICS